MMNILYMSCDIKTTSPIYRVIYTSLVNKSKKIYIFVGDIIDSKLKKVLKKIQVGDKLKSSDLTLLKNSDIEDLYKVVYPYTKTKQNEDIEFVYQKIRNDDTVSTIKKKIFVNISDTKKAEYITMNNQCLWMDLKNDKVKVIGYHYPNVELNPKDIYKKSIAIDKKFIRDDGSLKKRDYESTNDDLIGDIIQSCGIDKHKIYLLNAQDVYDYLLSKKLTITDKITNGFFKKYWPRFDIVKASKADELYDKVTTLNKYHNFVFDLLDETIVPDDEFGSCAITTIKFNTNVRKIKDHFWRRKHPTQPIQNLLLLNHQ